MNALIKFFIKQPLFVNLITLFVLVAGIVSLTSMNRDLFPNVTYDIVIVTTTYNGAAPQEIERLITIPLERELKEVDDIKEMTSASIENFSVIALELEPDADDKDKIVTDIQRAVDKAKDMPQDLLDPPVVREVKAKDIPVIEASLSGNMSEKDLQGHAKIFEDMLLDMPEVSAVVRRGWRDKEIWVEADPAKVSAYHIALAEVMSALARKNVSVPSGKLVREEKEYLLRTTGQFETADEIRNVIIRANDAGNWVRVKDIADVRDGFAEEQSIYKTNARRAINLVVVKRESADAIDMVSKVKDAAAKFKESTKNAPDISFVNDHSFYVKRRLNVLVQNGLLGFFLVIIILLLYLEPRVALFTALGIPVAFMATFFIMKALGITINLVSMFGLIIVLGMLVDDAIVISENVFRHVEMGKPLREAALIGTLEVWRPVTSSILTTIAAFAPLMFMTGIMGKFIWTIPVVVSIALLASLMEALFVLPSHLAEMERLPPMGLAKKLQFKKPQALLDKFGRWYGKFLYKALKRRLFVSGIASLLLIATLLAAKLILPVVLFPAKGIDVFFVRAKLPIGTPLEVTEEKFRPLERLVAEIPKSELNDYVTHIGMTQKDPNDPFTQRASHVGQIAVYLKPEVDRKRITKEIIAELREKSGGMTFFEELSFDEVTPGPPVGKPVAIRLRGENLSRLDEIAGDVKKFLSGIVGVLDIKDDYEEGKGELRVIVNEDEAARAGIMVGEVARAVKDAYDGGIATTIKKTDEEIDVRVRFPYGVKYDEESLKKVMILNSRGNLVPLSQIAEFKTEPGIQAILHLDRRRVVTVTANVDQNATTSMKVAKKLSDEYSDFSKKYPGYTISFGGEYEETEKSIGGLFRAFILALFIIFIILATDFKSLFQPFVVMITIPFGLIGVAIAFLLHGMPLSFLALIGTVGLTGVVVNSAIVLIEFINRRRAEGVARDDAIVEAGRVRLRPVMLTVVTTVAGLISVAYGLWGSDPILIPAAMALMWGLIFAAVLTLFILPCFYAVMDDVYEKLLFFKFWK